MSSNPIRLQFLYRKYTDGQITPDELKEFWLLIRELSDNDLLDDEILAFQKQLESEFRHSATPSRKHQHILDELLRKAAQGADFANHYRNKKSGRKKLWVAAAIIACLLLGGWYLVTQTKVLETQVNKKLVQNSGHRQYLLPDGTKVTVNIGSVLQYPPVFSDSLREVVLSGEGYFEVAHDPHKPFIVRTGKYTTRVLGTVFNIKAYPESEAIAVTVEEGKVQVNEGHKQIAILTPNNQLVVNKHDGKFNQVKVNAIAITEWKNEDIVFQNISLGDAAFFLEKRFGVQIKFTSEIAKACVFTGTYTSSDGLDQIIDIVTTVTGNEWKKEGNVIWITGDGCTS
jgi:transmembrane sensor